MAASVNIRRARLSDHERLAPLFEELDAFHREGAPWLFRKPEENPRPLSHLEGLLADSNMALLVAEAADDCVGLAHLVQREAPSFPVFVRQKYVVIDSIAVRADCRRHGIGRLLFEAAEAWARERGVGWVELSVYEFNEQASRFYAALGFETLKRTLRKPLDGRG